jgi:signal peptidase I
MRRKEENKLLTKLAKILLFILGIILGIFISRIFIVPIKLHNNSMEPNFSQGTRLIVLKRTSPSMGKVIVFKSPIQENKVLFGRVIAGPHDTVEVKDKNILVNDKAITFQWKTKNHDLNKFPMPFSFRDNMPQITLKDKEWFVLCDNIDFGFDGREFGPINEADIIGRVIFPRKK